MKRSIEPDIDVIYFQDILEKICTCITPNRRADVKKLIRLESLSKYHYHFIRNSFFTSLIIDISKLRLRYIEYVLLNYQFKNLYLTCSNITNNELHLLKGCFVLSLCGTNIDTDGLIELDGMYQRVQIDRKHLYNICLYVGDNGEHKSIFDGPDDVCHKLGILNPSLINAIDADDNTILIRLLHYPETINLLGCVRFLIENKININVENSYGTTALLMAVKNRLADIVRLLLGAGANPSSNIMTRAIEKDNFEIINLLLDYGADYNLADSAGWTPLTKAVELDDTDLVRFFIKLGTDLDVINEDDDSPLCLAIYNENMTMLKLLLDGCADPNYGKKAPLILAVEVGSVPMMKILFEYGVDINKIDKDHHTAFYMAARTKNVDMISYLLNADPDLTIRDALGGTILMTSIVHAANFKIMQRLIEAGMNINDVTDYGLNCLMICLSAFNINIESEDYNLILDYLIVHTADINCTDNLGLNAAMITVKESLPKELVYLLVDRGTDLLHVDAYGQNVLIQAFVMKADDDLIMHLIEKGADVNCIDQNHNNVLHYAITNSYDLNMIKFLVKYGATFQISADGSSPLTLAICQNAEPEMIAYMIRHGLDINYIKPSSGYSVVMLAIYHYKKDFVIVDLIDRCDNRNHIAPDTNSALSLTIQSKKTDIAKYLLDHEVNVDMIPVKNMIRNYRIYNNEIFQLLLSKLNINLLEDGINLLAYAIKHSASVEIILILLESGADPNQKIIDGSTDVEYYNSLTYAIKMKSWDIVDCLLKHSADPNIRFGMFYPQTNLIDPEFDAVTPLIYALKLKSKKIIIDTLLAHGADPNIKSSNQNSYSCLQLALGDLDQIDIVIKLLESGANSYVLDEDGWTAYLIAARDQRYRMQADILENIIISRILIE